MPIRDLVASGVGFSPGSVAYIPTRGFGSTSGLGLGAQMGVVIRYSDTSNYVRCYIDRGGLQVVLEKVVAGVATILGSAAWTLASTAELRVIAQGRRYRVWLDYVLVIDGEDADLNTNTTVGMVSQSTTAVLFEDFYAQKI